MIDEVDFLDADKHISFLQIDTMIFDGHDNSQSAQSNKLAIFLQYLKKEVRDGVHFYKASTNWNYRFLVSQLLLCSIVMQNM